MAAVAHRQADGRRHQDFLVDPIVWFRSESAAWTVMPDFFDAIQDTDVPGLVHRLRSKQHSRPHLCCIDNITTYMDKLHQLDGLISDLAPAYLPTRPYIWGPLRALLEVSSEYENAFNAVVQVMKRVGQQLPDFAEYRRLLEGGLISKLSLGAWLSDIFLIYRAMFDLFRNSCWKSLYEATWPEIDNWVSFRLEQMHHCRLLMTPGVNLATFFEAYLPALRACIKMVEHSRRNQEADLEELKHQLVTPDFEGELRSLQLYMHLTGASSDWLREDPISSLWMGDRADLTNILWIQGSRGEARKYSGMTVHCAQERDFAYAYVSVRQDAFFQSTMPTIHSLIFQLASRYPLLGRVVQRTMKKDNLFESLQDDPEFALGTLKWLFRCLNTTFLVIEGLDELKESMQQVFLEDIFRLMDGTYHCRILFSSTAIDAVSQTISDAGFEDNTLAIPAGAVVDEEFELQMQLVVQEHPPDPEAEAMQVNNDLEPPLSVGSLSPLLAEDSGVEDFIALFEFLIEMNQVDTMKDELPGFRRLERQHRRNLMEFSASYGSVRMTRLFWRELEGDPGGICAIAAARNQNAPVLRWALRLVNLTKVSYGPLVGSLVMDSDSAELFDIWRRNLVHNEAGKEALAPWVFRLDPNPPQERRLASFWVEQHSQSRFSTKELGQALHTIAQTSCSSILARALLDLGAYVDDKCCEQTDCTARTPLQLAAKNMSEEAADLMKLLLVYGAKPDESYVEAGECAMHWRTAGTEDGARGIQYWTGMTWDELVSWATERRRQWHEEGEVLHVDIDEWDAWV